MGAPAVFLAFTVLAAIFGFAGLAEGGVSIFAKTLFFIFLIFLIGSLLFQA